MELINCLSNVGGLLKSTENNRDISERINVSLLMIGPTPRSTLSSSSEASDVYKKQGYSHIDYLQKPYVRKQEIIGTLKKLYFNK